MKQILLILSESIATDGGMWADLAKNQNVKVRSSLEEQVSDRVTADSVGAAKLDWSAAEEGYHREDSPQSAHRIPFLGSSASVYTACMSEL